MFDVIGRRRWFYTFSLLITIPGLLFILLTPLTNGGVGLKFSIDYTGGTEWEFKFQDPNVTAAQIQTVLAAPKAGEVTLKLGDPLVIYSRFDLNNMLLERAERAETVNRLSGALEAARDSAPLGRARRNPVMRNLNN